MILGIGIDSVEIERFTHWHTYDCKKLLRIFSDAEIEYCLSNTQKSAERFAARFAAREALFKALSFLNTPLPFLQLCKATQIKKSSAGKPEISVDWELINAMQLSDCTVWLSLTHSRTTATAMVIVEKTKGL